jgi:hypothetical protein
MASSVGLQMVLCSAGLKTEVVEVRKGAMPQQ